MFVIEDYAEKAVGLTINVFHHDYNVVKMKIKVTLIRSNVLIRMTYIVMINAILAIRKD